MAKKRDEGVSYEEYINQNPPHSDWTEAIRAEVQKIETYVWGHSTSQISLFADKIYDECVDKLK